MSIIKHAVITAAGIGSRLGMNCPKCLVPVAGKPIINYQLDLLKDIEDIRIVVGFMKEKVIEHVKSIRPDAIFICNHQYASTTTLQSLFLGASGLTEPFLSLDGDVIPEPNSFKDFLECCLTHMPLTTICEASTTDAVYAITQQSDSNLTIVKSFQRAPSTMFEWPGISYLPPHWIENKNTFIFQQLEKYLPLVACKIKCWEIDTLEDLLRVTNAFKTTEY